MYPNIATGIRLQVHEGSSGRDRVYLQVPAYNRRVARWVGRLLCIHGISPVNMRHCHHSEQSADTARRCFAPGSTEAKVSSGEIHVVLHRICCRMYFRYGRRLLQAVKLYRYLRRYDVQPNSQGRRKDEMHSATRFSGQQRLVLSQCT